MSQESQDTALQLDGKASWFACVCASLASFVCVGTCYIYGIFFPEILEEFQAGKAKTALPGSFSVGALTILCPVAAFFLIRFGSRIVIPCGGLICALGLLGSSFAPDIIVLTLTHGLILAWGSCLVYMAGFHMVPLYFDKNRSLATGMVSAGPGAGVLLMTPIAQKLIEHFGWRITMQILAGINLVTSIPGCSVTRKVNSNNDERRKSVCSVVASTMTFSALKDPLLLLIVTMNATFYFGHYLPLVHLIEYAKDLGISSHNSSWMYAITGTISTICRILTGKVGDTGRVSFYHMFQCGLILMAITNFLIPLASKLEYLYAYAVMQGICEAMYFTSAYCLAMYASPEYGISWLMLFCSVPIFVSPVIAGAIADYTHSYTAVFYLAGCFLLLAAAMPFLRICIRRSHSSYQVEPINISPAQQSTNPSKQEPSNSTVQYTNNSPTPQQTNQSAHNFNSTSSHQQPIQTAYELPVLD